MLSFLREQAVTLLFLLGFVVIAGWAIRLHFSEEPEYAKFNLQRLLTYEDGTPNPRNISLWLATLSGLYFCFYLLVNDRGAFISFANWFLGILFGYAGATEIFGKKEASPAEGSTRITDTSTQERKVERTP